MLWALALAGAGLLNAKVLVEWDFTKPDALTGAIPLTLRGASRLGLATHSHSKSMRPSFSSSSSTKRRMVSRPATPHC